MDITITVSEKTEQIIREKAEANGKPISEFAANFLEEKIKEEFSETMENEAEGEEYENPFAAFTGMFSSGKTDTSERMHEILYSEDFDPAEGFSVKKMIDYLLDSGLLYASIDESDKHHEFVKNATEKIRGNIIFPVPAITETAYFLSKNKGIEEVAKFLDSLSVAKFQLETPTAEDYQRAAEIIRKYNDANIDFVDAIIAAIAERLNVTKILTVDRRHFGAFRPRHCAAFEILP